MIYLQPCGGLANRIRAIISALSLADQLNQKLIIYWRQDEGLNCAFQDLYEGHPRLQVKHFDLRVKLLNYVENKKLLRLFFEFIYRIDFFLFDQDFNKYVWSTKSDYIDMTLIPVNGRNYFIKTCHEFFFHRANFKYLRPKQEIQEMINNQLSIFPDKIIGLHIRQTDNEKSIAESPLELFIRKMKIELKADSDIQFFLATDDPSVEEQLTNLFSGKIIRTNKEFTRNSKEGIVGAMIDLYCLASTQKIYGSYWSSFSSVAARIGDIPLIIVREKAGH